MKKWITSLLGVILISGCSTIPSDPKPHSDKYAVQVLEVTTPGLLDPGAPQAAGWIEKTFKNPDAKVYEYPILYAAVGESVINDETKSVAMAEDFNVVDGKAVAQEKIQQLGRFLEVSITKVEHETITYKVNIQNRELFGFDTLQLEDGIVVQMPFLNAKKVTTELSQPLGVWSSLGGVADTRTENGNETSESFFFCIRIIPPAENK